MVSIRDINNTSSPLPPTDNSSQQQQLARALLTRHWGYAAFRPLQEEIVLSVMQGQDTLALLPTGGGKSICFQVPALAMEGICLVVSPLLALIKDQVERLRSKDIAAEAIMSGMPHKEIDRILDLCIYGRVKFLYVSPERLTSELFLARFQQMKVALIAVDEAHCISQWGYDFRPSYRNLSTIRTYAPQAPVLALTATATPEVQRDIQEQLHFRKSNILAKSFERKNLAYVVRQTDDKRGQLLRIAQRMEGTGIVYVRSRKRTREIAEWLQQKNIRASYYHAGLSMDDRSLVQQDWMTGKTRIMVATNAFGMGIDKADVRFVVHMDLPDSPEAYFQEAGRAGRDEQKAYAVLLFDPQDRLELERRAESSFPTLTQIKQVYTALGNYVQLPVGSGQGESFLFDLRAFSDSYALDPAVVIHSIRLLEMQSLVAYTDSPSFHSRLRFLTKPDHLYEFQVKNPDMDRFIRILMRSYEGLFSDYVNIREKEVAKRVGLSVQETGKRLHRLQTLGLVDYVQAVDTPQITYTEERLDSTNIHINREFLHDRKQRFLARAAAMLAYAENESECRSRMLLKYFGQTSDAACGVCDYCLKQLRTTLKEEDWKAIHQRIITELSKGPAPLARLTLLFPGFEEETVLSVLKDMLEHSEVIMTGADSVGLPNV